MADDRDPAPGVAKRVWRSVFRGPVVPRDDRERAWVVFNTLVLHLRPIRLPAATLRYTHTFGLGGMSMVLVAILMATGVLMMFVYVPSPERAYASVGRIESAVLFGTFVRAVHHWSANFLIVVATLHLCRVFFTGGFRGPRQFNWLLGLGLLGLIVASNFTGYLLPWDQLSYWAVTICTSMLSYVPAIGPWLERAVRGGQEIGAMTLVIFYALHTTVLPVSAIVLMSWHFWRVRKAGGVVIPPRPEVDAFGKPRQVLFLPNLLVREAAAAGVLISGVFLVAALFSAPLGEPANPGMSPNPAKAPWYFLGFQELLFHFHPTFAVVVIPLLALTGLVAVPYLRRESDLEGAWFLSPKGRRMACVAAATALVATPLWILGDEFLRGAEGWLPGVPSFVGDGLLPLGILLALAAVFQRGLRRGFAASREEAVQALFVLFLVGFSVLTAAGIWFRGPGMTLMWPWEG